MTDLYTLPELPYAYDALEPWCTSETLHLHHDKHHAAYVAAANKLSKAIQMIDVGDTSKLAGAQTAFEFNLGGHILHSLFWLNISPSKTTPTGEFEALLIADFGSQKRFHDLLSAACLAVQGSGWGALMYDTVSQTIRIGAIWNHQHDLVAATKVLAVIDVWEHAYYLTNHNDRATWVKAVIDHLDWQVIAERYDQACLEPVSSE